MLSETSYTLYIEYQHHGIYHAYSSHINRTFEPNARSQHSTGRRRVTPAATNSCHNVHGPKKYVSTAFTGNTNMKICTLWQNLFKFMRLHTNNRMETYGYPQHCTSMKLRACILAHEYPWSDSSIHMVLGCRLHQSQHPSQQHPLQTVHSCHYSPTSQLGESGWMITRNLHGLMFSANSSTK